MLTWFSILGMYFATKLEVEIYPTTMFSALNSRYFIEMTTMTASAPWVTISAPCGVQCCKRNFLLLAMSSGITP